MRSWGDGCGVGQLGWLGDVGQGVGNGDGGGDGSGATPQLPATSALFPPQLNALHQAKSPKAWKLSFQPTAVLLSRLIVTLTVSSRLHCPSPPVTVGTICAETPSGFPA